MQIIKRDGSKVDFDRNKITVAIKKALEACDMASDTIALSVTEDVVQAIGDVEEIDQEKVQDLVEDALMKRGMLKVAKAYIKYRYRHAMVRNNHTELINGVLDKLAAKHVQNQNANVDETSFGGRIGEAASFVMKTLALDFKMSDVSKNNHNDNLVYIHDLDQWLVGSHNCIQIPFDRLLANGFTTRQTDVRGAQSINTAFQLMAVLFQLQSLQQFGGVGATHCDATMVPYVRKSFKKHYMRRALEAYMDHELDLVGGPACEPDDELKAIDWKFPTRESWYALDDESLEHIEKTFNKWYIDSKGLTEEDFKFSNNKLDPSLKQYAIQDTRKEAYQAIEAFTHNMNTLQSRSGKTLIAA